jgi:iron complex transport system permease protein
MEKFKGTTFSHFLILSAIAMVTIVVSLFIGRYQISFMEFVSLLNLENVSENVRLNQIETIVFRIRLPRTIAAFLVGGTLSVTGAAYQGMFRNPMVSPSILGVSAGAGFGAALAIILGLETVLRQSFSFSFGIVAVFLVYFISSITGKKYDRTLTLILGGMIVATVFTALISILKYVADPDNTLPSIVYWLMGGLSDIEFKHVHFISIISIAGLALLSFSGWKLDILSFGDEEAKTMGIGVERFRLLIIVVATLMTSAAVSISGIIGWVGLLVPHITRMITGHKNTKMLPASFLIGGIFLLIVDDFSRSIATMEIPLGITTSLLGAPFFLYILMKTSKRKES